jgi:hypothetical protein
VIGYNFLFVIYLIWFTFALPKKFFIEIIDGSSENLPEDIIQRYHFELIEER